MNLNQNRMMQPQQMAQATPQQQMQQISTYVQSPSEPAHGQYYAFLMSNQQEIMRLYAFSEFYSRKTAKPLATAIAESFMFLAAGWIAERQLTVDQSLVEAVNGNLSTFMSLRAECNAQPQQMQPQQMQQQMQPQQMQIQQQQIQQQQRPPAMPGTINQMAGVGLGNTAGSDAMNKLGGGGIANAATTRIAQAPSAIGVTVTPATATVASTPVVELGFRAYLFKHDITEYQQLVEAYMDIDNHGNINNTLADELGVTDKVAGRRMDNVAAKLINNQTDTLPSNTAIFTSNESPVPSISDREMYTVLAEQKHGSNKENKQKDRVHTANDLTAMFADSPDKIDTRLISQMDDGGIQQLADRMLNFYEKHVDNMNDNYADINVVMCINDRITAYVNEYIAHRWGGVFAVESFMEDYNEVSTALSTEVGIRRHDVNSMCRSYRSTILLTEIDVPKYVSWCEKRTGIMLQRTIKDLGWECVTSVPLGMNDLHYNNLISIIKKADAVNRMINIYVESSCYRALLTSENRLTVALLY